MLVAQLHVQACYCHSTKAPYQEASSWICQNRSTSALLQHVPEPASYQPGIATQVLHVLGKAARLPAKSHKLSKPKPAELQAPVLSTASWGLKKQRQLSNSPTPRLPDTTSRDFWALQALVSSINHPAEQRAQA